MFSGLQARRPPTSSHCRNCVATVPADSWTSGDWKPWLTVSSNLHFHPAIGNPPTACLAASATCTPARPSRPTSARVPRLARRACLAGRGLPTLSEPSPSALASVPIPALPALVPFSALLPEAPLPAVLRLSITYSPSPTKTGSLPAPPKCPTTPPIEKTDPPVIPDADRSLTSPSGHVARRPTLLKRVQHLLRQMMRRPKPHLLHLFRLVRRQTPTAHPFPTVGTHRQHPRTR